MDNVLNRLIKCAKRADKWVVRTPTNRHIAGNCRNATGFIILCSCFPYFAIVASNTLIGSFAVGFWRTLDPRMERE